MVGQSEISAEVASFSKETAPHTILLLGPGGCGKHTVAKMIADRLEAPMRDITDSVGYELISEIQISTEPCLYLVDLDGIGDRAQNALLKFAEEPTLYSYVMMIASSDVGVLSTIMNRCYVMRFKPYSKDELMQFSDDGALVSYCATPGQVKSACCSVKDIEALCSGMAGKMARARFDNALSIADRMNYKDEYDKWDVDIFMSVLLTKLSEDCIIKKDEVSVRMYNIAREAKSGMLDARLSKRSVIELMIIRMWRAARDDVQGA
jgi:replication-associated recombination protein RarA